MATDRDIGPNAMLFYYITAGNQDLTFRMDRMTGEMVTRPAPPDRERQQEYRLTVTVEDDGTPPLSVSHKELGVLLLCGLAFSRKTKTFTLGWFEVWAISVCSAKDWWPLLGELSLSQWLLVFNPDKISKVDQIYITFFKDYYISTCNINLISF